MDPVFEAVGWLRVLMTIALMALGIWKCVDILIWYATF